MLSDVYEEYHVFPRTILEFLLLCFVGFRRIKEKKMWCNAFNMEFFVELVVRTKCV